MVTDLMIVLSPEDNVPHAVAASSIDYFTTVLCQQLLDGHMGSYLVSQKLLMVPPKALLVGKVNPRLEFDNFCE